MRPWEENDDVIDWRAAEAHANTIGAYLRQHRQVDGLVECAGCGWFKDERDFEMAPDGYVGCRYCCDVRVTRIIVADMEYPARCYSCRYPNTSHTSLCHICSQGPKGPTCGRCYGPVDADTGVCHPCRAEMLRLVGRPPGSKPYVQEVRP